MKLLKITFIIVIALVFAIVLLIHLEPEYAYMPPEEKILNKEQNLPHIFGLTKEGKSSFDIWGRLVSPKEAEQLLETDAGQRLLAAENGAIEINNELLLLGREAFYKETFSNEIFITDILGLLDGPLTLTNFSKAILELNGAGTTNLQVELAETVEVGGQTFHKGEKIDTGIDVPKGSYMPLGMPMKLVDGRIKVGISCAACHASVDPISKQVVEGAPNLDINTGLLLALATNSAAYFTNTELQSIEQFITEQSVSLPLIDGEEKKLPDQKKLEKHVDSILLKWPRGNFDSTIDLVSNPTQIPDSFTLGDHPYGWSGFAIAGPFHGLSSLNNNVHAQNSDILAQADQSEVLFDIDKEVYLGTILQNAAHDKYKYDVESGMLPSQFYATVDPTPQFVGSNENTKPPTYPKISLYSPNGTVISSPGFYVGEQINALSAFQNSLSAPKASLKLDRKQVERGKEVFSKAGCLSCHSGPAYTNNQIISVNEIKTEPSRAKAFKDTEKLWEKSFIYAPNTPVPIPNDAKILAVPTEHLDQEQIKLALAHGDSDGGYKVKGLIGLYWSAPYLHDGGVAIGPDKQRDLGIPGTLQIGVLPDPRNSLLALIDKELREKVIKANQENPSLKDVHVQGVGHEYWVDATTGFTTEEQDALITYLLSLNRPLEEKDVLPSDDDMVNQKNMD